VFQGSGASIPPRFMLVTSDYFYGGGLGFQPRLIFAYAPCFATYAFAFVNVLNLATPSFPLSKFHIVITSIWFLLFSCAVPYVYIAPY